MSKLALGTRAAATFFRILEFCISALILGIFSYYLAVLARRAGNPSIPKWEKAVEGISGGAVIYTAFAVVLTCFLGGITFFSFLGLVMDIIFCGGFVAIAVLARGGVDSCSGVNNSPIGPGEHLSCQLERVTFIVAIIGAFLFLVSAVLEILLSRAHKREKRYGPSPSNNYTSGYGKQRFWQKKNNKNKNKGMHDAELGAVGTGALVEEKHHHNNRHSAMRPSDDTAVGDGYGGPNTKYAEPTLPAQTHDYNDGYTAGPQFTGDNTRDSTMVGQGRTGYHTGAVTDRQVSGVSEMPGNTLGSADRPIVQHDDNPYAEVHHGGYVHTNPESNPYTRT
ncbi:hypothetical protein P7C71_g3088, partial [Lecanoromycetidae sp. Uapishka_2]